MSDRFKDIYRIQSARARWWDYSHKGIYFITICTQGMDCLLGEIVKNEMNLSFIGTYAAKCWQEIPEHFPFVKLHAWTIMPNHVHGIIEILPNVSVVTLHATSQHKSLPTLIEMRGEVLEEKTDEITWEMPGKISGELSGEISGELSGEISGEISGETLHATSLHRPQAIYMAKNQKMSSISPCRGSLGSIVRSYKSAVSKQVHKLHPHFGWQERFYDNIIKNTEAYHRIEIYIQNNVRNWDKDRLYKK